MSKNSRHSVFVGVANMIMAAIIPVAAGFAAFAHVSVI